MWRIPMHKVGCTRKQSKTSGVMPQFSRIWSTFAGFGIFSGFALFGSQSSFRWFLSHVSSIWQALQLENRLWWLFIMSWVWNSLILVMQIFVSPLRNSEKKCPPKKQTSCVWNLFFARCVCLIIMGPSPGKSLRKKSVRTYLHNSLISIL